LPPIINKTKPASSSREGRKSVGVERSDLAKLARFLLYRFALNPAVVETWPEQVPANRQIVATAAAAVGAQVN
jgi:hypothetical protein